MSDLCPNCGSPNNDVCMLPLPQGAACPFCFFVRPEHETTAPALQTPATGQPGSGAAHSGPMLQKFEKWFHGRFPNGLGGYSDLAKEAFYAGAFEFGEIMRTVPATATDAEIDQRMGAALNEIAAYWIERRKDLIKAGIRREQSKHNN
jgi:hypothetical protein